MGRELVDLVSACLGRREVSDPDIQLHKIRLKIREFQINCSATTLDFYARGLTEAPGCSNPFTSSVHLALQTKPDVRASTDYRYALPKLSRTVRILSIA